MQKNIIINRGDEARAKIEISFEETNFFFHAYKRAAKCVSEIVNQAIKYIDSYDENSGNGHAFYDYGNNIVAFCAERGQGKTTAMLSFSGELGRFSEKRENVLDLDFTDNKCYFEILESIDPTMLNEGVSVLKVFLSRLFYHFKVWIDADQTQLKRTPEMVNDYNRMLNLFKKCFSNIEHLSEDKKYEWDVDDLDTLSQMGDSSNLRKNIFELINLYFNITRRQKNEHCFLVVQIDDADLAIASASDICEYVRKFLRIPGVIVLMATDYEQLLHVINCQYTDEYNSLLRYDTTFNENCRKMAAKYLEKILPYGHRVELPKIKDVIVEEHDKLKLQYRVNGKNQFDVEFRGCNDIQEQLIRLLYLRTGIILLKNEEKIHPFLPCRMRELTHLIKLLFDMEEVDYEAIYEFDEYDEKRWHAIEVLQTNLQVFKQYFMRDWCINRLEKAEQQVVFKINEANKKRDDKQVYNVLMEYIGEYGSDSEEKNPKKKVNYRYILKYLVGEGLSDNTDLQAAVYLYYTIYLNNWFVNAFKDEKQYKEILNWMGYPLEVPDVLKSKKYSNKYYVAHFNLNISNITVFLNQDVTAGLTRVWMEMFCRAKMEANAEKPQELYVSVWENDKQNINFNTEVKEVVFDVFQPLNTIFTSDIWKGWKQEEEKTVAFAENSLEDESEIEKSNVLSLTSQMSSIFRRVKNIIANYDVQNYLMEQLEEKYQYMNLRRKEITWKALCLEIYASIDNIYREAFEYLGDECNLQTVLEHVFGQQKTYAMVFLSNEVNEDNYVKDYKKHLASAISEISNKANLLSGSNKEKYTEMILQYDNFFRAEIRNTIGPSILEQREDIASVNERVNDLWLIETEVINVHQRMLEDAYIYSDDIEQLTESINKHIDTLANISKKLVEWNF